MMPSCAPDQSCVASEDFVLDLEDTQSQIASEDFSFDASCDDSLGSQSSSDRPVTLDFTLDAGKFRLVYNLKRSNKRKDALIAPMKEEDKRLKTAALDSLGIKEGKHMAPTTGMTVAFKHCRGYSSNSSMAAIVDDKIHPETIKRWTIKTATSVLAVSVDFHRDSEQMIYDTESASIRVITHVIAADATKSKGGRNHKLQACRVVSRYFAGPEHGETTRHECWPDVLQALEGNGPYTYRLTKKQVRAAGCCVYDHDVAVHDEDMEVVRVMHQLGDMGPDCQWHRKEFGAEYLHFLWSWPFLWPCLSHQQSLGSGRILKHLGTVSVSMGLGKTYYSDLVKVININRQYPKVEMSKYDASAQQR